MIAVEQQCELFEYEIKDDGIILEKWLADIPEIVVPEQWAGMPLYEVNAYAFSGGKYQSISLPDTVRKIGRYAFYNCFELKKLEFATSIEDIGAGAFTGCRKVNCLVVRKKECRRSCFRDVLSEFTDAISVIYQAEEEAHLMFPEFYEEGIENTPARIIMTEIHGTGMYYRNSFVNGELQFAEYDRRFEMAKAQEYDGFLIRLVLGRLLYPYRLEEKAKVLYEDYLMNHVSDAVDYMRQDKNLEELKKIVNYQPVSEMLRNKMASIQKGVLDMAQQEKWTEAVSILMDQMHTDKPKRRMRFEL